MLSNIIVRWLIIILTLVLAFSYYKNGSDYRKHEISLYLVKNLSTKDAMSKNIDELILESEPVLTDKEIEKYDWQEHIFYIKKGFNLEQKMAGKVPLDGKPFVLVVDGSRIYLGSFWNMLSSFFYPDIPTIDSGWSREIDNNKYAIKYVIRYGAAEQDRRNDKRIYEALKSLGKLD